MEQAFRPNTTTKSLSASGSTGSVALITGDILTAWSGGTCRVYNAGSVVVFVAFGTSAVTAATATGLPVPPGQTEEFQIGPTDTYMAGITGSGTATVYATPGQGIVRGMAGSPASGSTVTGDVNIVQIAGVAVPVGAGAAATAMRVAIGTSLATYTDRSGTITSGGAAQQLAASNASRTGYFIQNVSAGDLWFSTLATAVANQPSIRLMSGQSITVTSPDVTSGAISVIGATTGQAFAAREW